MGGSGAVTGNGSRGVRKAVHPVVPNISANRAMILPTSTEIRGRDFIMGSHSERGLGVACVLLAGLQISAGRQKATNSHSFYNR